MADLPGAVINIDDIDIEDGIDILDHLESDAPLAQTEDSSDVAFLGSSLKGALSELSFAVGPFGGVIQAGTSWELANEEFMRVTRVVRSPNDEIRVHGILLVRNRRIYHQKSVQDGIDLCSLLPRRRNELCALVPLTSYQKSTDLLSLTHIRPLTSFVQLRNIVFSNDPQASLQPGQDFHETGPLICKYKFEKLRLPHSPQSIVRVSLLRKDECDLGAGLDVAQLQLQWRNELPDGIERYSLNTVRPAESYTYADLCSGAGGAACGAWQAGLRIACLVDNWTPAVKTLRMNFGDRSVRRMDIRDYAQLKDQSSELGYCVDVMHISFPCQPHSWLNRGQNPIRDAERIDLAYALGDILKARRPRIVTLEQVKAITQRREGQHFRTLINHLTSLGYSVEFGSAFMHEQGHVQKRERLIIAAACPGQTLPEWLRPTHGVWPLLRPFTTVNSILRRVVAVGLMAESIRRDLPRWNGDGLLQHCLTSGDKNYHPSGKRTLSLQERAELASFPGHWRFVGTMTDIKTMIGNCVPPVYAEALFRSCIKALEEIDDAIITLRQPIVLD